MRIGILVAAVAVAFMPVKGVLAASPLGEINIELYGNIIDFTCVAEGSDSDKSVTLGTWPTKQLGTTGSRTQAMPFTLKLTGCPPGAASITFFWKDGSAGPRTAGLKRCQSGDECGGRNTRSG